MFYVSVLSVTSSNEWIRKSGDFAPVKFHALLAVRDEADILDQSLRHFLTWADAIYVFDTGSLDHTWDIVQQFAAKDKRVIPLKKAEVFFSELSLRGWIFNQVRRHMRSGDWFLRVDADEFHHISPRDFIKTRVRKHETVVYHQYYDFRLTRSEAQAWEQGRETLADRQRPIQERRRWFTVNAYTEPRLCLYRESMQWPETVSFPYNAGYLARERLPIRHYPHRDPLQLARRCRLRAAMMAEPENLCNQHWSQADWRIHVVADDSPHLRYWRPGTDLPEFHFTNHLARVPKRLCQRLAHACLLPLLDRTRSSYSPAVYPQALPGGLIERLRMELGSGRE